MIWGVESSHEFIMLLENVYKRGFIMTSGVESRNELSMLWGDESRHGLIMLWAGKSRH